MQGEIASVLLNQSPTNVGVLLDPMFAYKKGGVWLAEKEMHDLLTGKSLVLDRTWTLLFDAKKDIRDNRPLAYRGRILESAGAVEKSPWRHTKLFGGYTDPAQQLPARDMVTWQDLQPDALPSSTDESAVVVQGAHKFQQIGVDGAKKILLGMLEDSELGQRTPLLVVDIHCGVGNFTDAFIETRGKFNRPMCYVGLVDDPVGIQWLQQTKLEAIALAISKGELKVPGHNPNPESIDALVEQRPARPTLNVLIFGQDDSDGMPSCLHLPEAHKTWITHPKYGGEFNRFLDRMHEEHADVNLSLMPVTAGGAAVAEALKSKRPASSTEVSDNKKQKTAVDPTHIIEATGTSPLLEVPLVGLKSGTGQLLILSQNKMQLMNTSDQDPLVVAMGTVIAGFGRGRWKQQAADHDPEKDILYKLANYDDLVLNGTDALPILEVVNEKRKTLPDCRVAYHDIVPLAPNDGLPVGAFKLVPTVNIVFSHSHHPSLTLAICRLAWRPHAPSQLGTVITAA